MTNRRRSQEVAALLRVIGHLLVVCLACGGATEVIAGTADTVGRQSHIIQAASTRTRAKRRALQQEGQRECRSLYSWDDFIGAIDGRDYAGIARFGEIFSLDTPVYDNEYLEGNPVAVLRGSMVDDMLAQFSTGTLAYTFYDGNDLLVVHFGVSTEQIRQRQQQQNGDGANSATESHDGNDYGIPLGGTGPWTDFTGFVTIQKTGREFDSPSITNYTICPPGPAFTD